MENLFGQELTPRELEILGILNQKLNVGVPEGGYQLMSGIEQIIGKTTNFGVVDLHALGVPARALDKIQLKVFGHKDNRCRLRILNKRGVAQNRSWSFWSM